MSKVYRVNSKTKDIKQEEFQKDIFLGGRGLIANTLINEVNPACDPLGSENKLIVCTSLFAGTSVPTANRLSIGGKSPLTNGVKESNVGGTFGKRLADHDIKMIVIEDLPDNDDIYILKIDTDSSLELVLANEYKLMDNYELVEKFKEKYGNDVSSISIGSAGERGYLISSIQCTELSTGSPSRAAARGGLGALMGSKKIKAMVALKADNPVKAEYADAEKFKDGVKGLVDLLNVNPFALGLSQVGTSLITVASHGAGVLPVNNFSGKKCTEENVAKISPEAFATITLGRGGKVNQACQIGCPIKCSNLYKDEEGNEITSALEYETIALCGPNLGIYSFDTIAKLDRLCDDIGIDTMELGGIIGIVMESGKISWGDEEGVLKFIQELVNGTEVGKVMGKGTIATGEYFNVDKVAQVKNQALSAYDPRGAKGLGVTYSKSPQGADHTAGYALNLPFYNPLMKEGQGVVSEKLQIISALCDNLMCSFAAGPLLIHMEHLVNMLDGIYGMGLTVNDCLGIGVKTLVIEHNFNKMAGFTDKDNRLPEFFYKEKSEYTGTVFDVSNQDIDRFYTLDPYMG